ncbi:MAG: PhzF family phenazine biosynthesis protein [Halioglobus sp.]|nr:PhzF family phenazine biosynthesis protein [Halioglobus sp.]
MGGNPCRLVMRQATQTELDRLVGSMTVCQSWRGTDDAAAISVRCVSASGQTIHCCGHGLLAAAHAWQQHLGCERLTLEMHGSRILSWRRDTLTWLRFEAAETSACDVPSWTTRVFPNQQSPLCAARSGGEQGYLILQWPDGSDLFALRPRLDRFVQETGRALICTAAQPEWGPGAIQLRYHAPQYGVPEDGATGSAMRILGEYWSWRFDRLTARQCSPGGGWLFANWAAGCVDVGGRCVPLGTGAACA